MNLTRKGVNASRRLTSPGSSGVQDEVQDLRTTQPASTFLRAVVVRVLNDPTQLSDDVKLELEGLVSNPEHVARAPRNSIIVRIVSSGQDRRGATPILCFPFLPSHFAVPVKTGEQVWVLFENPQAGGSLPYWMWKTSEAGHVEDVNYTHADRKFDRAGSLSTSEKLDAIDSNPTVPSFPNGAGTSSTYTLKGANDYETVIGEDPAYKNFTPEPVPRFTKRPGDLTLQGSNNTLLVLGQDRRGPAQKEEVDQKDASGAIDIVTGRGRFLPEPGSDPEETAPRVIENSRAVLEVEKNPELNNAKDNNLEGDPDYIRDSSRLYLAMDSNGDELFNLKNNMPAAFDESIVEIKESPYAVLKSDEVRIIARKDDEKNINGSIRIVKEGDVGGNQVALIMLPDGTAQLDANVIYLGRPGGSGPGSSGSEPYIKFSKYKSQLEELIGIIEKMLTSYDAAFAVPVAAPGTPHPGLSINGVAANTVAKSELTSLKAKIDEAKSARIFGE